MNILVRKTIGAITLGLFLSGSLLVGANLATPPRTSVDAINATELRQHLSFLASEELGGRYTLSPGFAIAARYLAAHLEAYGYKPVGDNGTYFQHFEVIASKPKPDQCSLTLTVKGERLHLEFGDFSTFASGDGSAEGRIVFVGYGISAPEQKHDDYAGLDVKGKIVLYASGNPAGIDDARLKTEEQREGAARAHGAVAVIRLPSRRIAGRMRSGQYRESASRPATVRLAKAAKNALPSITLSPAAADKLLAPISLTLDKIFDLTKDGGALPTKALEATAKIQLTVEATRSATQNVVGVLEGTDPQLKTEYIAFSAHYDHLQTNAKGQIYPGADDDGSGITSVLAIAHALSENRPKRSVFVIFHAGEELGLLGSRYNTDFSPAVSLDKVVADLNIDMIGRSKPPGDQEEKDKNLTDAGTVYLVGADRISKELNQISEQTNRDFENLKIDYLYNDPKNAEQIYYRSDHWNYAKHGIPIIFYFDGTHVDYHQPTDTIDKIDFTKMTRIARLVFETGWRLANLDHHLAIDQPPLGAGKAFAASGK